MAADGGRCISDRAALADQPAPFSDVASISTVRRVLLSVGEAEVDAICQARAPARARAWKAGVVPERVILDFEQRRSRLTPRSGTPPGHYKGGFHPLLVSWGRELLAGILRPGNTVRAGNAEAHLSLLELALEQFPASALEGRDPGAL